MFIDNKMGNKKSELQIMETIMVVIIIVVMILIGMVFFYKYMVAGIDNGMKDYQKKVFDNSIYTFPQQAEVSCSKAGVKESCLDSYKMIGFSDAVLGKKSFYEGIYGYKNITLEIVYPPQSKGLCKNDKIIDCSTYTLYLNMPAEVKGKRVKTTPVSVYLTDKKEYAIGLLTITGYNVGV